MNKPNGISDKVWEMAEDVMRSSPFAMEAADYFDATVELIALAISKAIEEERLSNALIAENYRENMSFWMGSEWKVAKEAAKGAGQQIAQAIRSRSKGGK